MSDSYMVVLLVEQALTEADAAQVISLHEEIEEQVVHHVLLPMEDAAARIEAAMGSLSGAETMSSPAAMISDEDLAAVREDAKVQSDDALSTTLAALTAGGATVTGEVVHDDPILALTDAVRRLDGREAIILTRSHVVAEFFHLDWTSRARRKIGVPVLHLLEHENFDEQAGSGEGVTGL